MTDSTRHHERTREGCGFEGGRQILRECAQDDIAKTSPVPLLATLLAGYVLLAIIGYVVFRSDAAMVRGNEMSRDRAIFTVVNAITLTGFQHTVATADYLMPGKATVMALMAGGAMVCLCAGGMAVSRIAKLPYADAEIAIASASLIVLGTLAGSAALMAGGQAWFEATFLSLSALGNCGLHVGALPPANDVRAYAALFPLSIVGGFGVVVLLDLRDRILKRRPGLSPFTQAVLTMTALLYLIGIAAYSLLSIFTDCGPSAVAASGHALNSRGAGFPFEFASTFSRSIQWTYLLFMVIGAASGGTSGGIKVNTLFELGRGMRRNLNRAPPTSRSFGVALAWLTIYLTMIFIGLLLMLNIVPQMPADRLLFLVVSAAGNVGLSHDPVAIVKDGLYVLVLLMIFGKVLPLLILSWMAWTSRGDHHEVPVG